MQTQLVKTGKYGSTTLRAVEILQSSKCTAEEAWKQAAAEIFPDSPASRDKGCPRQAFLGLCEQGRIKGVDPARCSTSNGRRNREYARAAVDIICGDESLTSRTAELWRRVMERVNQPVNKRENRQLDVVLALQSANLIRND